MVRWWHKVRGYIVKNVFIHMLGYVEVTLWLHYIVVMMGAMASQITSLTIVCSIFYSGANQRKLRVTDLCAGNSPVTGEFPAQMASNAENVSIWWLICGCFDDKIQCHQWRESWHWWDSLFNVGWEACLNKKKHLKICAWLSEGTKPLTESILTSHQRGQVTINWRQFHQRYPSHHSLKITWKILI